MAASDTFARIHSVKPTRGRNLLVVFRNGAQRIYDCTPLLDVDAFRPLRDLAFFRSVRPDPHGYGVIWNDEIDLAESEIWLNGRDPEAGQ